MEGHGALRLCSRIRQRTIGPLLGQPPLDRHDLEPLRCCALGLEVGHLAHVLADDGLPQRCEVVDDARILNTIALTSSQRVRSTLSPVIPMTTSVPTTTVFGGMLISMTRMLHL